MILPFKVAGKILCPGGHSLCREAPPERRTFVRLQVYERVEISLVEVYERVGKSAFGSVKGPKRANGGILWIWKRRENFLVFVICVMT